MYVTTLKYAQLRITSMIFLVISLRRSHKGNENITEPNGESNDEASYVDYKNKSKCLKVLVSMLFNDVLGGDVCITYRAKGNRDMSIQIPPLSPLVLHCNEYVFSRLSSCFKFQELTRPWAFYFIQKNKQISDAMVKPSYMM